MSNSKRTKLDQCNLAQLHERTRANTNTHMCHIYTQPNRTPVRGMPQDACNGRRVMRLCYGALRARARVCANNRWCATHGGGWDHPHNVCVCSTGLFFEFITFASRSVTFYALIQTHTHTHTHVSARLSPCKSFIIYTVY